MENKGINNYEERNKELHMLLIELGIIFRDVCEEEGIWYSLAFGTLLGAVRDKKIIPWDDDIDIYILYKDQDKLRKAFEKRHYEGIVYRNHNTAPRCLQSHDTLYSLKSEKFHDVHLDIYPIIGAPSDKKKQNMLAYKWFYLDPIMRSKYVNIRDCYRKVKASIAKVLDHCIPDAVFKSIITRAENKYDMNETGYWMTLICYGPNRSCFPVSFLDGVEKQELNGEKFQVFKEWDKYLTIVFGDYMTPVKYNQYI